MARIALDVQTLQNPDKDRGIGRFIAGQIKHLLTAAATVGHTYLLVGNERLTPPVGLDVPLTFLPLSPPDGLPDRACETSLTKWAARNDVMLLYMTSPLRYDIALPNPSPSLVTTAMVHDLIPLLFEDEDLSRLPGRVRNDYSRRLGWLSTCRHLLTYSESNRSDIERELGIPADRITVVGAAAEPRFRPESDPGRLARIRERYGIRRRFVLSVTGFNFRKNLKGTIGAFARLPTELRRDTSLVLACGFGSEEEWAIVERLIAERNMADNVVLPGYVGDDLPLLYNAADVFFLPTRYEGFGIPVLEAMSCGTPVVTSSVSSLPEIVADAGILVQPEDEAAGAEALRRVLNDGDLRREMRERGFRRAKEFTWDRVVDHTLAGFERALATETVRIAGQNKPRPVLRQISAFPPVRSGIADYAERLAGCLLHWYRMEADSGGEERQAGRDSADRILYHVGNSHHNYPAFRAALERPGVVVLHDWSLHGMVHHCTVGHGEPQTYIDLMSAAYGSSGRRHAEKVIAGQESIDFLSYPLCDPLLRSSRGVVVHSQWLLERVAALGNHAPVRLIPHGADVFEGSVEIPEETAELGIPPDRFVILCFGRINRHKRIDVLLRVFQQFRARFEDAFLVLAGEIDQSAQHALRPLLERSGLGGSLRVLGYVPRERVPPLIRAASVCVSLRFPTLGETSGSVLRVMGVGRPVIVTDAGAFRELPDECAWKVPVDVKEADLLLAYMETLYLRPDLREQMGSNARRWIRKSRLWERVAATYASFLEHCYDSSSS